MARDTQNGVETLRHSRYRVASGAPAMEMLMKAKIGQLDCTISFVGCSFTFPYISSDTTLGLLPVSSYHSTNCCFALSARREIIMSYRSCAMITTHVQVCIKD